jgi:phenylpropionate dioxygenase-like ring-hydroxylating dioxygenase large terminal subunit
LNLDTWGGFIFVTFNSNPKPLLEALGNAPEVYVPYQMERLRLAVKFPCELNVNWKLLNENLVDIYHVAVLHTGTVGRINPSAPIGSR